MKTKNLISIAILCLVLFNCCAEGARESSNKQRQSSTCGVPQVISGDVRTVTPWSAAIFTRATSGKGQLKFFTNGIIIGPSTIVSVAGGPFGVTQRGAKSSRYSIPSADIFHVWAGINTTDFGAHDEFAQTSRVVFVEPFRGHEFTNEHYHFFLYHLKTPLNFSTPYVKEICLPLTLKNSIRNQSPYGWQLIQGGFAQGSLSSPLLLKAWKVTTGPKKLCESAFRYHYKREIGSIQAVCGRRDWNSSVNTVPYAVIVKSVDKGENDNDLCHLHGSSLSFEIGKVWYLGTFVILIPGRRRGRCSHKSFYMFSGDLFTHLDWVTRGLTCSPNKFACGDSSCIPITSLCNSIPDCKDESDEDPTFCGAQNNCPAKTRDHSHSCGLRGGCVSKDVVCDGKPDCDNKSDEYPGLCQGGNVTRSSSRTSSRRKSCPVIKPFEATVVTCTDSATNRMVECDTANFEGARVTLECDAYHRPHFSYDSVEMTCTADGEWRGRKPFSCDQECGIIREDQLDNYSGLPWHAVIYSTVNERNSQTCSAVLIEKKFLLTAAHCVSTWLEGSRELIKVLLNPTSSKLSANLQSKFLQVSPVKQIWVSPNAKTSGDSLPGALAMIEMQNPAVIDAKNRPTPACYTIPPFRIPVAGKMGVVTGFGIGSDGIYADPLKIGNVTVASREECGSFGFCTESHDGAPLCNADIGGGIFFQQQAGDRMAYVLKGIATPVSLKGCTDSRYSAFTSIDQYTDWILDILESYS